MSAFATGFAYIASTVSANNINTRAVVALDLRLGFRRPTKVDSKWTAASYAIAAEYEARRAVTKLPPADLVVTSTGLRVDLAAGATEAQLRQHCNALINAAQAAGAIAFPG
jgi:hypothetical protein